MSDIYRSSILACGDRRWIEYKGHQVEITKGPDDKLSVCHEGSLLSAWNSAELRELFIELINEQEQVV